MKTKRTNINLKPDSQKYITAIRQATGKREDISIIDHALYVTWELIETMPNVYELLCKEQDDE